MTDEEDKEKEKEKTSGKKKGGKEEAGSVRRASPNEAAHALMRERGLTLDQIKDILRNWRYLSAKEVAVRLADFGNDIAKASAHIVVTFSHDAGYALVTNILKQSRRLANLARKLTFKKQVDNKNKPNLG